MTPEKTEPTAKVSGEDVKGFKLYSSSIGDYMHRLIFRVPLLGSFRLHLIMRSDRAEGLHDHPFDFWSLLLTGSYDEVLGGGAIKHWPRWSWVRRKAETQHRLIVKEPVWTLVWASPNRRPWGFVLDGVWTYWRDAQAQWENNAHKGQ